MKIQSIFSIKMKIQSIFSIKLEIRSIFELNALYFDDFLEVIFCPKMHHRNGLKGKHYIIMKVKWLGAVGYF